jgi:hypothetical protein
MDSSSFSATIGAWSGLVPLGALKKPAAHDSKDNIGVTRYFLQKFADAQRGRKHTAIPTAQPFSPPIAIITSGRTSTIGLFSF